MILLMPTVRIKHVTGIQIIIKIIYMEPINDRAVRSIDKIRKF